MPVEIRKLPKTEDLPVTPVKMRWFIFIIVCIFTGFLLTLYFWPKDMSTHTFWFWMCALLIPTGVGVISYGIRLRHYEQQWQRVSYWNQLHHEKQADMVALGQQALGLLGMAYITPAANNKLAAALLQGAAPLQTRYSLESDSVLTMAQLQPPAVIFTDTEYIARLEHYLELTLLMLEPELEKYATNKSVIVRIRHDETLDDAQFLSIWQRIFPERYSIAQVTFGHQDNGLMWLDTWLDVQSSALLLSLEVNLFTEGRNYEAESVSALLLASPTWLALQDENPVAWIHRPVTVNTAKEALEDVVRWGKIFAGDAYFIWRSQLATAPQTDMLQAMDAMGYPFDKDQEHQIDSSFGKPAVAIGNIALICACDHVISTQQPQWLMLQDKTPQWAIVRPA